MKDFAYFCPKCHASHHYQLYMAESVIMKGGVWIRALGKECTKAHWVWFRCSYEDYEVLCVEHKVQPKDRED